MTRLRARHEAPARPPNVPEGSVVTVFRVPPEMAGMRVDTFLQGQFHRTSRTRTKLIVRLSAFASNGRRLRPGERVLAEQRVLLWRAPWDETSVPTDLPVLYEDEQFLAVHKPAGLPVHPTARYYKNTVIKQLEAARPDEWLTLAHRIDRETSGVLLLSRSPAADRAVKAMFRQHASITKQYVAITYGEPSCRAFRVDFPLELDPTSKTKVRMRVAAPGEGLTAATVFTVEQTRGRRDGRRYALLRCTLETGRQHQIRLHLAATGTPLVGDKLYAFDEDHFCRDVDGQTTADDRERLELPRHALHAACLAFTHPFSGKTVTIEAPLPPDLRDFWEQLALEAKDPTTSPFLDERVSND